MIGSATTCSALRAQPNQQFKGTLRTCRDLMRQLGVPQVIRSDLGSPFASTGLGRLSCLSVWWIEQGIEVEFTRPASPQDNGSHERMHRDLKAEVAQSPSPSFPAQQRRFERWRHTYNHERPHEALDLQCPADFYHPSARRLNENDRALVYPKHFEVKTVSPSGHLAHEGHNYLVGEAFSGKRVGLRPPRRRANRPVLRQCPTRPSHHQPRRCVAPSGLHHSYAGLRQTHHQAHTKTFDLSPEAGEEGLRPHSPTPPPPRFS
ncbi:MAG: transposase [Opitutaceae bacterium]|nr:transposase [Opitutaceae bacterium]